MDVAALGYVATAIKAAHHFGGGNGAVPFGDHFGDLSGDSPTFGAASVGAMAHTSLVTGAKAAWEYLQGEVAGAPTLDRLGNGWRAAAGSSRDLAVDLERHRAFQLRQELGERPRCDILRLAHEQHSRRSSLTPFQAIPHSPSTSIPDDAWSVAAARVLGLASPAFRSFKGMDFRLKSKGGVFTVNDVDEYGLGASVSDLIVRSGLATRRHNAIVKIVAATLRASGLEASEEPKHLFADLLPHAERKQGPGTSGIVPDIAFIDTDNTRRLVEIKAITSLPQWYKTTIVDWPTGLGGV